jgi:hypothetical protein
VSYLKTIPYVLQKALPGPLNHCNIKESILLRAILGAGILPTQIPNAPSRPRAFSIHMMHLDTDRSNATMIMMHLDTDRSNATMIGHK